MTNWSGPVRRSTVLGDDFISLAEIVLFSHMQVNGKLLIHFSHLFSQITAAGMEDVYKRQGLWQ